MKLIDILNKVEKEEPGYFKFWVKYSETANELECINWTYNNGVITGDDDSIFYFLKSNVYKLNSEVVVIKNMTNKWEELKSWLEEQLNSHEYYDYDDSFSVHYVMNKIKELEAEYEITK